MAHCRTLASILTAGVDMLTPGMGGIYTQVSAGRDKFSLQQAVD